MSLFHGLLYFLSITITSTFHNTYGWPAEICGLAYTPLGFGFLVGLISVAKTNDRAVVKLIRRDNGVFEPEMRLPAMIFYSIILPITFFWYGWAAEKGVFWLVPVLGLFPFV